MKKEIKKGDQILRNGVIYFFDRYGDRTYDGKKEILAHDGSGNNTHFLEGHWDKVWRTPPIKK